MWFSRHTVRGSQTRSQVGNGRQSAAVDGAEGVPHGCDADVWWALKVVVGPKQFGLWASEVGRRR